VRAFAAAPMVILPQAGSSLDLRRYESDGIFGRLPQCQLLLRRAALQLMIAWSAMGQPQASKIKGRSAA
jgi:hypothetical protein